MDETRERFDELIDDFENECRAQRRPDIDNYLARVSEIERSSLLKELAGLDLEYRLRSGESVRVEEFLSRFPALQSEPSAALELIALEYRVRQSRSEHATVAEYLDRFPDLRSKLPTILEPMNRELSEVLSPPKEKDEIGRLGYYRVLKVLGRGGMGVVLLGHDPHLDRPVALKLMLAHVARNAAARLRFLREARAAAKLKSDHIVTIHQVAEDRGVPYLVMEYLEGVSLEQALRQSRALPLSQICRIIREVSRGLADAHQHGLIHRDIKPSNIWLDQAHGGRAKILDFGLTRSQKDADVTDSDAIVGTPAYMSPEQARAEKVDFRADLFSLGCVLYRLCVGTSPFRGESAMVVLMAVGTHHPTPPSQINSQIPEALSDLTMRLLSKEAKDRPASALEVITLVRQIEKATSFENADESRTQIDVPPVRRPRTTPIIGDATIAAPESAKPKRFPWIAVVLAACLLLVGFGVWAYLRTTDPNMPNEPGEFVIITDDPDFVFLVNHGAVTLEDRKTKRRYALKVVDGNSATGEFVLAVADVAADLSFKAKTITIQRGREVALSSHIERTRFADNGPPVKTIEPRKTPRIDPPKKATTPDKNDPKFTNELGMEFVLVGKGKIWLGGGAERPARRQVDFAQDYYIGAYEVTQGEWEKVMRSNPSAFSRTGKYSNQVSEIPDDELNRFPVDSVSWDACQEFIARINDNLKEDGWYYRLPTDEEWEYACRGGPLAKIDDQEFSYYAGEPSNSLTPDQANVNESGYKRPRKVGAYAPNRLGLFDMHGNVWEWFQDARGFGRLRGGSFYDKAPTTTATSAIILSRISPPRVGLRLARVQFGPAAKYTNALGMEFSVVPGGKLWLGGEAGRVGTTVIEFKDGYYLGTHEVTQGEWEAIMGTNPSSFSRLGKNKEKVVQFTDADLKRFPVESVSLEDCQEFVTRVNEKLKETAWIYRLPTQAEWEFACRGGPFQHKEDYGFDYYTPAPARTLAPGQANFSNPRPAKVGSFPPNRLGLFDMHGNVAEWCQDGPALRIIRGGGYEDRAEDCRANHLGKPVGFSNGVGLRLVRIPFGPLTRYTNALGMEFALVPKGKARLGGGHGVGGNNVKTATIKNDYYLGVYEVTQGEWELIMGSNPSRFSRMGKGKNQVTSHGPDELKRFPVDSVSWDDCRTFVDKLNAKLKESEWTYRLPTQVEWEYACRGGPFQEPHVYNYDFYTDIPMSNLLKSHANHKANELNRTAKVGSYLPNRLGIYDMHGNVAEWCNDFAVPAKGAVGPVVMGGSYDEDTQFAKANYRVQPSATNPARFGLRLARVQK